jgi:hypothetical protein
VPPTREIFAETNTYITFLFFWLHHFPIFLEQLHDQVDKKEKRKNQPELHDQVKQHSF